jgi:hypothetical protein
MPHPLPNATSKFRAGVQAADTVKYPHLPLSIPARAKHVTFPRLRKCPGAKPATHRPMGMTLPILTKMGGHPLDTATTLPMMDGIKKPAGRRMR